MTHTFITFQKEHSTRLSFANSAGRSCLTFLFILSISSLLRVSAQQTESILFHGMVLDADTRLPLSGAHYVIKNRSAGAADHYPSIA